MNDPPTGLWNRRAFFEKAKQAIAKVDDTNRPIAIMFDVGPFQARQRHLWARYAATRCCKPSRERRRAPVPKMLGATIVGRLAGGEEFAILLEGATLAARVAVAESLREKVAALTFGTPQGRLTVTCSLGVSAWHTGESIDQLLKHADTALYQAKAGGRNCVIVAGQSAPAADAAAGSGVVRSSARSDLSGDASAATAARETTPLAIAPGSAPTADTRLLPASAYVLDDEPQIAAVVGKVLSSCGVEPRQFTAAGPFPGRARRGAAGPDRSRSRARPVRRRRDHPRSRNLEISRRGAPHQRARRHHSGRDRPNRRAARPSNAGAVAQAVSRRRPQATVGCAVGRRAGGDCATRRSRRRVPRRRRSRSLKPCTTTGWKCGTSPRSTCARYKSAAPKRLVRARHPVHGLITPAHFLPPAGDPAYEPLSRFVIARTMNDWQRFADQGLYLRLSVNVPISVMHAQNFIPMLRSFLPAHAAFPGLILEITEDEIIRDPRWAREIATQLKLYNVGISIDDFGSAYASLSRLVTDLPVVEVKIDRSFVARCSADRLKQGLCQTVVGPGAPFRRDGLRGRGGGWTRGLARAHGDAMRRSAGIPVRQANVGRGFRGLAGAADRPLDLLGPR